MTEIKLNVLAEIKRKNVCKTITIFIMYFLDKTKKKRKINQNHFRLQ